MVIERKEGRKEGRQAGGVERKREGRSEIPRWPREKLTHPVSQGTVWHGCILLLFVTGVMLSFNAVTSVAAQPSAKRIINNLF